MSGRLLFKEKQLRLCVVAALTPIAAPVAEALLLPPKPLASNISWSCQPGVNDWLCQTNWQGYKSKPTEQPFAQPAVVTPDDTQDLYNQATSQIVAETPPPSIDLLQSPKDHYVLQWMAAKERSQLEALKQRYPILKNATIAQYQRSGVTWFVLLDGPYPSRIAAMAELETPPRSHMATELYPWTRSMASIQKLDQLQLEYPTRQLADNLQAEYLPVPTPQQLAAASDYNNTYKVTYKSEGSDQTLTYEEPYKESYEQRYQRTDDSQSYQSYPSDQPQTGYKSMNGKAHRAETQKPVFSNNSITYGNEFNEGVNTVSASDQNYRVYPEEAAPQEMYVSITPAYRSTIAEQQAPLDYNIQGNYSQTEPAPAFTNRKLRAEPEKPPKTPNVLTANPKSYTIEWMNGSRKASLERARLRYSELQGTQIIHYRRNNRNRYALVSMLFINRSEALDALLTPSLSRVSTRFSPRIRQVGYLQSLVESTQRVANNEALKSREKSLYKRRSINKHYNSDKAYLVNRSNRQQRNVQPTLYQRQPPKNVTPTTSVTQKVQPRSFLDGSTNSYTIQWFSSSTLESVEKLKQRFPELASAETVHIKRNKKSWYILVQGNYRNSQDAITALKSPAMQNIAMILHPWTRPLSSLKKMQFASL